MTQRWVSLPDAASRLNVSVRTVERRIQKGELPARPTDQGRQVMIDAPDQSADIVADTVSVIAEHDRQQREIVKHLADAYQLPLTQTRMELKRSQRWSVTGWSLAFGLASLVGLAGAEWRAERQQKATLADNLSDARSQLVQAQQQTQGVLEGAAEERQQLTQALQSAQADLQEAILDAQEAAQRKIADRTTDSPSKFNLADSEAIGGLWPELGAANPFGQSHGNIFAAGLMPEGQGEH